MEFNVTSLILWIIIGIVAGWLTGVVVKGRGYGIVGDLVLGLLGALVGGFLVGLVWHGSVGVVGSIIVAFIGAVVLVTLLRAFASSRSTL